MCRNLDGIYPIPPSANNNMLLQSISIYFTYGRKQRGFYLADFFYKNKQSKKNYLKKKLLTVTFILNFFALTFSRFNLLLILKSFFKNSKFPTKNPNSTPLQYASVAVKTIIIIQLNFKCQYR